MTASLVFRAPTPAEYARLRAAVGWDAVDADAVAIGLRRTPFAVCLEDRGRVIGCGRVIGDGGIDFYIQDVIVVPEFQGRGYGAQIMDAVMGYLERVARPGTFIGLMAAKGAAGFYLRYGFSERPAGRPGMYRVWASADNALPE